MAQRLIQSVHSILGWTRDGSSRLLGATSSSPLAGGLRIGKEDEFGADGDGQYHHYLTLWMFALNRASFTTLDPAYNTLALQLAKAIHPKFVTRRDEPRPRIFWKMSMDLSHPLVSSEGNLDPFDGYCVFRLLHESRMAGEEGLDEEIADYKRIMEAKWGDYVSSDPLDLGMMLWTAHWRQAEDWAVTLKEGAMEALSRAAPFPSCDIGY